MKDASKRFSLWHTPRPCKDEYSVAFLRVCCSIVGLVGHCFSFPCYYLIDIDIAPTQHKMQSISEMWERCGTSFPWSQIIRDGPWPPGPDVPLFRPPCADSHTLRGLHASLSQKWREANPNTEPMPLDVAEKYDVHFNHHGRPHSAVTAFYALLFAAWDALGWGHREESSFLFPATGLPTDLRFHTKLRRTASVVDLDETAKIYHIPKDGMRLLLQRLPGIEVSVFHILDKHLGQPFTLENGCALQDCVIQVAKEFRARVTSPDKELLKMIWDQRNIHIIIWNTKDVRVWHWPETCSAALLRVATHCLLRLQKNDPPVASSVATENQFTDSRSGLQLRDMAVQYSVKDASRPRNGKRTNVEDDACLCHFLRSGDLAPLEDNCMWCMRSLVLSIQKRFILTFVP